MIALLRRGAACGAAADQSLHLAAGLQQAKLLGYVDRRDQQAALRQHHDQMLARQPLDRLPDWRTADSRHFAELQFRHGTTRRQLQRHDGFFYLLVCQVGQLAALAWSLFRLLYWRRTGARGGF
ncbi:hypothetical protein D3C87_1153060 [compost metagenome]